MRHMRIVLKPLNPMRQKKFSWHNVCLISTQRPTARRVAGFQTWRTMGRFVRKGEKGIAIMAPIVGRREAESDGDNARTVVGFRAAYVFDGLSQDSDLDGVDFRRNTHRQEVGMESREAEARGARGSTPRNPRQPDRLDLAPCQA